MFHVIRLDTGKPIEDSEGKPFVFDNGRDAAESARAHTEMLGTRCQPRPIKTDSDWRSREHARFCDGTYRHVPWVNFAWWQYHLEKYPDHFAHISTGRDGMIAYTADESKGMADRQTRVRPGRYLTEFCGDHLDSETIQALAREFAGQYEEHVLKFANTADEIEHVYKEGPGSCMSGYDDDGDPKEFDSDVYPTRVYAAGDLAVAYIVIDDKIAARSLCWPEKKRYGRIYGDQARIEPLLNAAGFNSGSLRGAKLKRIEQGHRLVCPYIDGCTSVSDHGTYLTIDGELDASSTSGLIDLEPQFTCARCGDGGSEDDSYYLDDVGESWCSHCYESHTYTCARSGETYGDSSSVVEMADGSFWSLREFERNGFECEGNGQNYHIDDAINLKTGETWSRDYFSDNGFTCTECDEAFSQDDMAKHTDGICRDCHADMEPDAEPAEPKPRRCVAGRDENPNQLELTV